MEKNKKYIIFLFLIAGLFYSIICINKYYIGHDFSYHYHQIMDYVERIDLNHIIPSPISKTLANSLGYGSSLFYPPFMHVITAYIVKIFSIDVVVGINIVNFLAFFLSGVSMYFLALKLLSDKKVSFLASIFYLFFTYHISDVVIRSALAESWIFVFFPMIINGLIELVKGNFSKFYILFIVGYVGSIYSHYLSAFYLSFLLIPFLLFYFKNIFTRKKFFALLTSVILILMITLPLISSILQHKLLGDYKVFHFDLMTTEIIFNNSILSFFDYFLIPDSGSSLGVPVFIGYEMWVFLSVLFVKRKNLNTEVKRIVKLLIAMSITTIFFLSFKLFWDFFSMGRMIQFVWRLLIMLAITLSLLSATTLFVLNKKYHNFLLLFCTFYGMIINISIISSSTGMLKDYQKPLGVQSEYLPLSCSNDYIDSRNSEILILEGNASIKKIEEDVPYLKFQIDQLDGSAQIELPRIYYLGYELENEDGSKVRLQESVNGFLEAKINKKGVYTLSYKGTKLSQYSKCIAIMGILLFFIGICFSRKKECVNKI